ncbi:unnamed protein product [Chironomus riparius]|uniref:Uncharacterized protein n=1 Tax=Chironomus riparius TaxID=315576 RepID=A0A9N9WWN5_9DIPT|nr:unnamed protein product [Chironomus riparius]
MFAVNNNNCVCFVGDKLDGMTMEREKNAAPYSASINLCMEVRKIAWFCMLNSLQIYSGSEKLS